MRLQDSTRRIYRSHTTPVTEDISRLAKWSGGEKLTVCVALYCTIVALRAARTGRGSRPGGGSTHCDLHRQ